MKKRKHVTAEGLRGLDRLAVLVPPLRIQAPPPRDFAIIPLLDDIRSIPQHDLQMFAHNGERQVVDAEHVR